MSDPAPSQTSSRQLANKARLPWFFASSDYSLEGRGLVATLVLASRGPTQDRGVQFARAGLWEAALSSRGGRVWTSRESATALRVQSAKNPARQVTECSDLQGT